MKRVRVSARKPFNRNDRTVWETVPDGEASFHQWGVDYEEFENGPGNYSVAIIERDNGKIETVRPEMIEFIK